MVQKKKKKTAGSQTGDHLMKYNPKLDKVKKDICWEESSLAENSTSSLHVYSNNEANWLLSDYNPQFTVKPLRA